MNERLERFFEFADAHNVSFTKLLTSTSEMRYCGETECYDCTFTSSCFNDGCLSQEDVDFLKENHPEYLI